MTEADEHPHGCGGEVVDVEPKKWKAVYTIVETKTKTAERKVWLRIGTAYVNRDGSMNVKLDAIPTNGTLHIRDYEAFKPQEK